MKIIELLNKIANGEEVPRKIAYCDIPYVYVGSNRGGIKYVNEEHDFNEGSRYLMYMIDDLNDEVEILEEAKEIPEKLEKYYDDNLEEYVVETYIKGVNYKEIFNSKYDEMIINKLNEVLDYLKSKGDE